MANSRDSIRRNATDPLLVYDMEANLPIGQIINLSDRGFKLMTEQPMEVSRVYNCRMPIPDDIADKKEIIFLAECRWCRLNEETTWYDSGYYIRKIAPGDLKIIQSIRRKWMIDLSNKINASDGNQKIDKREEKRGLFARLFG
ncbi:MAG TPA: hypothetical protein ENL22_06890 [candidate division Zixibacteria bacterium]|nr:hypothetical protein [candidate division Zixibacteria bacterium]